jgi:hypothetical protein
VPFVQVPLAEYVRTVVVLTHVDAGGELQVVSCIG